MWELLQKFNDIRTAESSQITKYDLKRFRKKRFAEFQILYKKVRENPDLPQIAGFLNSVNKVYAVNVIQ